MMHRRWLELLPIMQTSSLAKSRMLNWLAFALHLTKAEAQKIGILKPRFRHAIMS